MIEAVAEAGMIMTGGGAGVVPLEGKFVIVLVTSCCQSLGIID